MEIFIFFEKDRIVFECAKYGDGCGGSLIIKVKMNDQIKESLDEAIKQWKIQQQASDSNEGDVI